MICLWVGIEGLEDSVGNDRGINKETEVLGVKDHESKEVKPVAVSAHQSLISATDVVLHLPLTFSHDLKPFLQVVMLEKIAL